MLIDEISRLDPYKFPGITREGQDLIAKFIGNSTNIPKFFLTEDFVNFSKTDDGIYYLEYIEKIKHLVRLPYSPMIVEFASKGRRYCAIFYTLNNSISVCSFLEILVNGQKLIQAVIYDFVPSSMHRMKYTPCKDENYICNVNKLFFIGDLSKESENDLMNGTLQIMDIIARLNSKGITEIRNEESLSKLNKSRVKKGKYPLSEYKIVSLSQSIKGMEKEKYSNPKSSHQRFHWVRGHFKITKNGMFWWNPYAAGKATLGTIKKDYIKDAPHNKNKD